MGNIIDGRFIATAYKNEIKDFVAHKVNCNERPPKMATILVGEDGGVHILCEKPNKAM